MSSQVALSSLYFIKSVLVHFICTHIAECMNPMCMQDDFHSISEEIFDIASPNWYREAPEQGKDPVQTGDLDTLKVTKLIHDGGICKMVSSQYLKKCRRLAKFGTQKHQGQAKNKFEPGAFDFILRSQRSSKIVSTHY